MAQKAEPITSVTEGLAKVLRAIRLLKTEVAEVKERLAKFTDKHPIPPTPRPVGLEWRQRAQTDEPKSAIEAARYEYLEGSDLTIPTRTLVAMAKELDGALRDIRAARSDIDAVVNDSDLRDDFKSWLDGQRT